MSIEIHSRPGTPGLRLVEQADTSHESASDWYANYGWHLSTARAGDVELQAVDYDWLDDADNAAVVARLLESDGDLDQDEAEEIVSRARDVRDAAEAIEASLEQAVEMYFDGDLDGVETALAEARQLEYEHGDSPASDGLREQLIEEAPPVVDDDADDDDDES